MSSFESSPSGLPATETLVAIEDAGIHPPTEHDSPTGEVVGSMEVTAELLISALDAQTQLARQRALEEQRARQNEARDDLEVMTAGFQAKAAAKPEYYADPVLNRYEPGRRQRERGSIDKENEARRERGAPEIAAPTYPGDTEKDYSIYGKSRWGRAALDGKLFWEGSQDPLYPTNRRDARRVRRAARVATRNIGTRMAKEALERDPRTNTDGMTEAEKEATNYRKARGGTRHGGFAIDPNTSQSRFRDLDPDLKKLSRRDRKIVKHSEKAHKKLAQKERNEQIYLENQGSGFIKRHNVKERISERFLPKRSLETLKTTRKNTRKRAASRRGGSDGSDGDVIDLSSIT
ncbi:hypothetical protein KDA00_00335 [Candidatus Saccharibacteria bacterium]|nr:hypothetical protein [Candidatus Saccharibacteria bacterium]